MAHSIASSVWGGSSAPVTTHHGEDVRSWNPDCSWYQYGIRYCLNGCQHPGADIGVSYVNLYAKRGGRIIMAGFYDFYRPYHVQIETANGDIDVYGHMWSIDPAIIEGGTVAAGQFLGVSGEQTYEGTMTPDGSGPHLHFEVRRPDSSCSSGYRAIDPEPILTGSGGGTPPGGTEFNIGDEIRVFDGPLNVRSAPGGTIVGSIPAEGVICVLGGPVVQGGYTWYEVSYASLSGWVAGEFCTLHDAGGCASTPPSDGAFKVNDRIRVFDGPLNVRSGPGSGYSVVTSFAEGTEMCVLGGPTSAGGYTWYQIDAAGSQGWVAGEFCELVASGACADDGGGGTPTYTHEVTGQTLNLRTCASTSCSVVGVMPIGTKLRILDGPTTAEGYTWYQVDAEGFGTGWCVNGFDPIGDGGGTPTYTHRVTNSALNLRTCASIGCGVIAALPIGTRLYVIAGPQYAEGYTWYHIQPEGYAAGWSVNGFDPA